MIDILYLAKFWFWYVSLCLCSSSSSFLLLFFKMFPTYIIIIRSNNRDFFSTALRSTIPACRIVGGLPLFHHIHCFDDRLIIFAEVTLQNDDQDYRIVFMSGLSSSSMADSRSIAANYVVSSWIIEWCFLHWLNFVVVSYHSISSVLACFFPYKT